MIPLSEINTWQLDGIDIQDIPIGLVIDDMEIVSFVGNGGYCVAYEVKDHWCNEKTRILKIVTRGEGIIRTQQEFALLKTLPEHPFIMQAVELGNLNNEDGTLYIVVEYADGTNVEQLIKDKSLSVATSLRLITQTAEALQHMHQNGVCHQDIKPANIILTKEGVCVIDFNLASSKQLGIFGRGKTKGFFPPDFDTGNPSMSAMIDRDVYALGITLYRCITGKHPYQKENRCPTKESVPTDPTTIEGVNISEALRDFMLIAVQPCSENRYNTIEQFINALNKAREQ